MDSDFDSLQVGLYDAELVAIPNGLLQTQSNSVYLSGRKAEAVEADPARFDVREVLKTPARVARAASINLGDLQRTQCTGIQCPANALSIIDEQAERPESLYRFAGGPPVLLDDPHLKRPKRALTKPSRKYRRSRNSSTVTPPPAWLAGVNTRPLEQHRGAPDGLTDQSHIFRDLSSFNFGQRRRSSNHPSLFYTRENSIDRERAGSVSPGMSIALTMESLNLGASQHAATRQMTASSVGTSPIRRASVVVVDTFTNVTSKVRRSSMASIYEKAKIRQEHLKRSPCVQCLFEYSMYILLIASVYLGLVGLPLWRGVVWYIYVLIATKFVIVGGSAIFVGLAAFYAFGPLICLFEPSAPVHFRAHPSVLRSWGADSTALVIPCYKSEKLLAATLEAALEIFPQQNIFVVANGNSPIPLDKTESVCTTYGVNHTWCPIGCKLIAQFVGARICKRFPYVIFIDDDCLLPPNFPVVTDRLNVRTKCIGYTIKSTGPNSSRGTLCQQAQDLEYKLSGIQRLFAGKIGSATFPHGAISLWDREFCVQTFKEHPGFSVSEDWFFGHVARKLGSRIEMCTSVFVETETPASLFWAGRGAARGGFGEMTVFKQRFKRWNFFFVNAMYYNMPYILFSWKLGWRELGAKIFVFQEVYETLLYLVTPFVLPISFLVRPLFCLYLFAGTAGLYLINAVIFNEVHLRMRNERVKTGVLLYYMGFKFILTFVNVASCYWSIWKYAKYFAKRHPKVVEDSKVVEVVLRIEDEEEEEDERLLRASGDAGSVYKGPRGRRMTVTAVGVRVGDVVAKQGSGEDEAVGRREGIQAQDFAV